eukprot:Sro2022_g311490.2  (330) ;mRNA; r:5155-6144
MDELPDDIAVDPDTGDAMALRGLTCTILMEEAILLSKLGFTADENGIAVMLAMLKAHAARRPLGSMGVSVARLEEVFALWWYARHGSRFHFLPGCATSPEEQAARSVIVVFTDLHTNPDWTSIVQNASGDLILDVLLVLDPNVSCFCQDPNGGWNGCDYFLSELEACIQDYQSSMFLGCSFGASAALRFSSLANEVLAFAPHVDIPNCKELVRRTDIPAKVKFDFQDDLVRAVSSTEAYICVHYASLWKQQRVNVELLPKIQGVDLIAHNTREHDLCSHLDGTCELLDIVTRAIEDFTGPATPRSPKKICTGRVTPVPSLESCHTNSQL